MTSLLSGCRNKHRKFKVIIINYLVIWDKVALHESDIVHRLTQNTGNVVLPDVEHFQNLVWKPTIAMRSLQIIAIINC